MNKCYKSVPCFIAEIKLPTITFTCRHPAVTLKSLLLLHLQDQIAHRIIQGFKDFIIFCLDSCWRPNQMLHHKQGFVISYWFHVLFVLQLPAFHGIKTNTSVLCWRSIITIITCLIIFDHINNFKLWTTADVWRVKILTYLKQCPSSQSYKSHNSAGFSVQPACFHQSSFVKLDRTEYQAGLGGLGWWSLLTDSSLLTLLHCWIKTGLWCHHPIRPTVGKRPYYMTKQEK